MGSGALVLKISVIRELRILHTLSNNFGFKRLKMDKEYGLIKIPKEIIRKIEERIKGTEFKSVDEYTTFVLKEVIKDNDENEEVFSEEDEQKVKERLKALGYLE
jgi:hypothetical protein